VINLIETDNSSITESASKVMLGGILSLAGGLASNILVAAIYGAGANMDAYLTALVIPVYFQIIFYSSLSFVFIPAFIEAETKKGDEDAWALVGSFFWITTFILFFIAIIGSLYSASIINMIAPGFQEGKSALASQMLSILFFTTPFVGLGTLTVGIQNARNRFFWPSFAPAVGSLGNVIVLMMFSRFLGPLALCWGFFVSTVLQAGITIIPVLSHSWKKTLPLTDHRVGDLGKLMLPLIIFGMLTSLSPITERYFSSGLPDGQIAYMGYANKISSIFVVLLASGIASAIFPSMARTYAQEGIRGLTEMNDFGLRLTFAVALPTIVIIGAVAVPLTSVFFERGAFQHPDTLGVSQIVFAYLLGNVLIRMVGNIFQRSFYVLKNTSTQPIVDSIFVILFIATARFFVMHWGYVGLVWAGVVRSGLAMLTLWVLLLRKLPQDNSRNTFLSITKYCGAALAVYICGRFILLFLSFLPVIFQLAGCGLLSASLYIFILYFLDKAILVSVLELFGIRYFLSRFQKSKNWLVQINPIQGEGASDDRTHIRL
jgi:putative peptidoglycan lipid II flippase